MLGRKLDISSEGGDLAERDTSWSLNSIPDIPSRAHRCYKITTEIFNSCTCTLGTQWIQSNHGGSPSNLSQLGSQEAIRGSWIFTILHLIIIDWIMWRYKQHSLLSYNLKLSVSLECMPICNAFHWLVVSTNLTLHWA